MRNNNSNRDFHWRGGDVLKEKEYLSKEYKVVLSEYHKALMIRDNLKQQVNIADQELQEKQGYSDALSSFLDGNKKLSKE